MSVKDLFEGINKKVLSNKSLADLTRDVESEDYIEAHRRQEDKYEPPVNFARPKNFARFGSAEKYFENSIQHVHNNYPYDGSLREKISWHVSASYLDNYIFEHEYPRTNGYALLSADGWGTFSAGYTSGAIAKYYGGTAAADYEYIKFAGNLHRSVATAEIRGIDSLDPTVPDSFPSNGGNANLLDEANQRGLNLDIDVSQGVTVEFWLKKDGFDSDNTIKEVVLDVWNGKVSSSVDYGRLTIELSGTAESESPWRLTLQSGSQGNGGSGTGFYNLPIGQDIDGTASLSTWKHYAFSFVTADSAVHTRFYVDGDLNQETIVSIPQINKITGSMVGYIGALQTKPGADEFTGVAAMTGWGKLSGSIDEFRLWKTRRDSEQIGRYWFDQVGAGVNTDLANTDLGVYFKFNEGVTGVDEVDKKVLDYSGRISNGTWTGYDSSSRATGSAIVLSNAATKEFKDPIIYHFHPEVSDLVETKRLLGREHDYNNNASIYFNMYPDWIADEDGSAEGHLSKLTQIVSSYLDDLYIQIGHYTKLKSNKYLVDGPSGSAFKPIPFADKLISSMGLVTPELFSEISFLEQFEDRNEEKVFSNKLYNLKNTIYTNIYSNLVDIYKSKGTPDSFRNLFRCFGVDEELIKINLYSSNEQYILRDNYVPVSRGNRVIDFNNPNRIHSVVSHDISGSHTFLSASYNQALEGGLAMTVECDVIFPKKINEADPNFFTKNFITSSIFGSQTATGSLTSYAFAPTNVANFQVHAVRPEANSTSAKFQLTGTLGGNIGKHNLTSSYYNSVYDNEKWTFAVRVYPQQYPHAGAVENDGTHKVSFYGVNAHTDLIINEFEVTGTLTNVEAESFLINPKRFFVGSHRTNITGALLQNTDVKISACRVWMDYLDNETIQQHAIVTTNYGADAPFMSSRFLHNASSDTRVPKIDTLTLNWNFETVTGSNALGEFAVDDFSSGSTDDRYGWFTKVGKKEHKARGYEFPASKTDFCDFDYTFAYKKQLPEVLNSDSTINVLTRDDETFTREHRPINYFVAFEKSMYQEISNEMIDMFATVKNFSNLIGEPVNRYRQDYKHMEKLRQLFFERVSNTPDVEKFVEFYKWIDDAVSVILMQLVPASANTSDKIRTMIESHVLERNKYWTKFPTLEMKNSDPVGNLKGVNELFENWRFNHAPIVFDENRNTDWWENRVERGQAPSGDSEVDSQRDTIRIRRNTLVSGSTYAVRRLSRPFRFSSNIVEQQLGGSNVGANTKSNAHRTALQPKTANSIDITLGGLKDSIDGLDPDSATVVGKKIKIPLNASGLIGGEFTSGDRVAPFTVFSSSAENSTIEVSDNKQITNLHNDSYGDLKERPLQGPFTDRHVGGLAYRHVDIAEENILVPAVPPTSASADYTHELSAGDRTSLMSVAIGSGTSATWTDASAGGAANQGSLNTVDDVGTKNNITMSNSRVTLGGTNYTNATITWDFGTNLLVTEARIWGDVGNGAHNGGTWKWQGSTNNLSYTDIGTTFTFSGSYGFQTKIETAFYSGSFTQLSGNTTQYRYYRLLATAHPGSGGKNLAIYEADFKIDTETPAFYRLPNEREREEGFRLKIENNTVNIMQPEKDPGGNINHDLPVARYLRDEGAKRSLNIRNIETITGSEALGNYDQLVQVVQTSNRTTNNRWWVESEAATGSSESNSFLLGAEKRLGNRVTGAFEYKKAVRGRTPHVIVERFSAPGGPETMGDSDGGPGLDAIAAEYSIHNMLNYRNSLVRGALDEWQTERAGQFGVDIDGSVRELDYDTLASFHKTNRNRIKKLEESGSSIITASLHDNWFVQHPIPQSDIQYAWITASAISAPFGYATDQRRDIANAETITFVSASDFGFAERKQGPPSFIRALVWGYPQNSVAEAGSDHFTPASIVGLNFPVYEPITASSNILGYPAGVPLIGRVSAIGGGPPSTNIDDSTDQEIRYLNALQNNQGGLYYVAGDYDGGEAAKTEPQLFNALMLKRNGPYGYPSWRQIRTGDHPIARNQKKTNEYQYIVDNGKRSTGVFESFTESPITSKYYPLQHQLSLDETDTVIKLTHTYANNITYFGNNTVANKMNLRNTSRQTYNELVDIYLRSDLEGDSNPINNFVSLRYKEVVFPKPEYTYLNRARSKPNYNVLDEIGWDSDGFDRRVGRTARGIVAHTIGFVADTVNEPTDSQGNSNAPFRQSRWPLDGRRGDVLLARTGSFEQGGVYTISSSKPGALRIPGHDGTGELLNDYCQFHSGTFANIKPAALYARRDIGYNPDGIFIVGDAKWEAPEQSGLYPFHDTYDDYSDIIKRVGKDYTILPEFRISDHIEYFVDEQGGNFLADIPNNAFLKLDGGSLTSSAESGFFKEYSHTDFMRFFDVIAGDHEGTDIGSARKITLRCKALKKFRPREGFYPAQRALQLATLFSKSYGPITKITSSIPTSATGEASWRTMLQPFYAPGILFNTIKSGIAVDYPIITAASRTVDTAATSPRRLNRYVTASATRFSDLDFTDHNVDSITVLSGNFGKRLPFEALVDPMSYLDKVQVVDNEPHLSASIMSTASFEGSPGLSHKLGMNNFLAETINFYLKDQRLNFFASRDDQSDTFGQVQKESNIIKEYVMDVFLKEGTGTPVEAGELTLRANSDNRVEPTQESSLNMYTRPEAFGPPVFAGKISAGGNDRTTFGSAPFTPPYYDGFARARLTFKPTEAKKFSAQEIVSNITIEYYASTLLNGSQVQSEANHNHNNAMQLSASVNLDGLIKGKKAVFDNQGNITGFEDDPNFGDRWVLQTKMETPVLDFTHVTASVPTSGSRRLTTAGGSVPVGMWHQYGRIAPNSDQGIFFEVVDVADSEKDKNFLTGSLIDLVGFERASKPIGQVANALEVREAVIAIPFVINSGQKSRFSIDKTRLNSILNGDPTPGRDGSIIDMIDKMNKYVLPPSLDFITNDSIEPFAMYIFEFKYSFSQQDLVDMWQNLAPRRIFKDEGFELAEASIQHDLFADSFLSQLPRQRDIRWEVFKVKQKADTDYSQKVISRNAPLSSLINKKSLLGRISKDKDVLDSNVIDQGENLDYGFNWPYDYFSIVELVKLEAEMSFEPEGPARRSLGPTNDIDKNDRVTDAVEENNDVEQRVRNALLRDLPPRGRNT